MLAAIFFMGSTALPFLLAIATLFYVSRDLPGRRGIRVWAILILLMPIVGIPLTIFVRQQQKRQAITVATGPQSLKSMTTTAILQERLPKQIDEPWVWSELEGRVGLGDLTPEQAHTAVTILTEHLNQLPRPASRPLSWQGKFLDMAANNDLLTDKDIQNLAISYFGEPTIELPRLRENAKAVQVSIEYGTHWDLKTAGALLWTPTITLDGKPFELEKQNQHRTSFSGSNRKSLSVGDHELKVVIDCVLVAEEKLIGLNRHRLPRSSWPKPTSSWQKTVTVPFKVYTTDEPIVELVIRPELSPAKNIRVKRVVVQPYTSKSANGATKKMLIRFNCDDTPIPFGFSVIANHGDSEIPLGSILAYHHQSGGMTTRLECSGYLKNLDDSIRNVDIVLRPDAKVLETVSDVATMWGKSLKFPNVPLERLDLEAESVHSPEE